MRGTQKVYSHYGRRQGCGSGQNDGPCQVSASQYGFLVTLDPRRSSLDTDAVIYDEGIELPTCQSQGTDDTHDLAVGIGPGDRTGACCGIS